MKNTYLIFIIIFLPFLIAAQDFSGVILTQTNEPIMGAYIQHARTSAHTHSNEIGQFLMEGIQVGDTLQVLHIGYESINYVVEAPLSAVKIKLTESFFDLGEVVVGQNTKQVSVVAAVDVRAAPVKSSQELLRKVPGLFIGQHAGGGKAEQIFLRGFDIDHGTDVQISVDGMPVNMVSHAHGQGYSDLHFVIPETIEKIDYGKGPYYADKGNFGTAGYVEFQTKDKIEHSEFNVSAGRFNSFRSLGMLKLLDTEKHHVYVASEYTLTDGYFESSQNFSRNNLMAKYSGEFANNKRITLLASHFSSKWDASGQIPQRLVDQGAIIRFGAVDDTEGGNTGRTNFALTFNQQLSDHSFMKSNLYYSLYDFELYSNFTFFLNDPVNGDQIRQKEKRQVFGFENIWNYATFLNKASTLV